MEGEKNVDVRTDYGNMSLTENVAGMDPMELFSTWSSEAENDGCPDHNAMVLATVGSASLSNRVVLLRSFERQRPGIPHQLQQPKGDGH